MAAFFHFYFKTLLDDGWYLFCLLCLLFALALVSVGLDYVGMACWWTR